MTPLAHLVLKQLVAPSKMRPFNDAGHILPLMKDVHYFDCRAVTGVAAGLLETVSLESEKFKMIVEALSFLPAPKTWIEVRSAANWGFLLIQDDAHADVHLIRNDAKQFGSYPFSLRIPLRGAPDRQIDAFGKGRELFDARTREAFWRVLAGCLALINSHRAVGRRQHMPHAGLQRQLSQKFHGRSDFLLRPWTEILLQIDPATPDEDGETHVRHLTGARARHFVRKYMRVRSGKAEIVSDHWRGDESLGIKQSSYRLAPKGGS